MHGWWRIEAQVLAAAALLTIGAGPAFGANPVFVDAAGICAGHTPCFTTIQQGVNHVDPDGVVFIRPGNYPESVDLSMMGSGITGGMPGNVSLAIGTSVLDVFQLLAPDAVIMKPASGPAFFNSSPTFPGDISLIGGFTVVSANDHGVRLHATGSVNIVGMTASGNANEGIDIVADSDVMVFLSRADSNTGNGMALLATGGIAVVNSTANHNGAVGMVLKTMNDSILVQNFGVLVGVPLFPSTSTADSNAADGMDINSGSDVQLGATILTQGVNVPANIASKLPKPDGAAMLKRAGLDRFPGFNAIVAAAPGSSTFVPVTANLNGALGVNIVAAGGVTAFAMTTNNNAGMGFLANAADSVLLVASSADGNTTGFYLSSAGESVGLILVTALNNAVDGVSVVTASNVIVETSFIRGNQTGINILALGTGTPNAVNGSIICSNSTAGLNIVPTSVTLNAEGNWWGAANGPAPSGGGNKVVGTSDISPFIDTVTAKGPSLPATVGLFSPFTFQFSGGNGTVFLGSILGQTEATVGPGDPFGLPPFTLTTDNGKLNSFGLAIFSTPVFEQTGTTVGGFITEPRGVLKVLEFPAVPGQVTVSLTGPCGLTGSATADVNRVPAPAMSGTGLGVLAALLAMGGFGVARRRSARVRRGD